MNYICLAVASLYCTCDDAKGDVSAVLLVQICHEEWPHHAGQAPAGSQQGQPHTLHTTSQSEQGKPHTLHTTSQSEQGKPHTPLT